MDLGVPLGKLHHKSMGWNGVGLLESNLTDLGVLTKRLYKKLVCPTATSDSHGMSRTSGSAYMWPSACVLVPAECFV